MAQQLLPDSPAATTPEPIDLSGLPNIYWVPPPPIGKMLSPPAQNPLPAPALIPPSAAPVIVRSEQPTYENFQWTPESFIQYVKENKPPSQAIEALWEARSLSEANMILNQAFERQARNERLEHLWQSATPFLLAALVLALLATFVLIFVKRRQIYRAAIRPAIVATVRGSHAVANAIATEAREIGNDARKGEPAADRESIEQDKR